MVVAVGLLMSACKSDNLRMMTQNLYLGANIGRLVLGEDPAAIWGTIQFTRFQDRAVALAKTMARHKPHVIALQEVSHYIIKVVSNDHEILNFSFQDVLMRALEAQGLHYRAVAQSPGVDLTFPSKLDGVGDVTLQYQGYNLLLVDASIKVGNVEEKKYDTQLNYPIGGDLEVAFTRGYTVTELKKGMASFNVVNTHLEVYDPSHTQLAQAQELIEYINNVGTDMFVLGDLNSPSPNTSLAGADQMAAYQSFLDAGFQDSFLDVNRDSMDTSTCCYSETLTEEKGDLSEGRIDHILYRKKNNSTVAAAIVKRVFFTGLDSSDKAPGALNDSSKPSLWPSDHLGVVMEISLRDRSAKMSTR